MSPFISIFGLKIPTYGLMCTLGVVLSLIPVFLHFRKKKYDMLDLVGLGGFCLAGSVIGSKLLFIIVSARQIFNGEISFSDLMTGGFVFYGGLIGGIAGIYIYCKVYKIDFISVSDILFSAVPLAHAVGRIGCFACGCCYGKECDCAISYTYRISLGGAPVGVPLLPVQLIESACLILLFAVLQIMYLKCGNRKKGLCSALYVFAYSVIRFVLEFFRGDLIRGVFLLSTSQWISLVMAVALAVFIPFYLKKNKSTGDNTEKSADAAE